MKKLPILAILLAQTTLFAQTISETYPEDPASIEQAGVPKGEIIKGAFENSKIFPSAWREYSFRALGKRTISVLVVLILMFFLFKIKKILCPAVYKTLISNVLVLVNYIATQTRFATCLSYPLSIFSFFYGKKEKKHLIIIIKKAF